MKRGRRSGSRFLLSNFKRTDFLFRLFRRAPRFVRDALIDRYVEAFRRDDLDSTCPDRMTLFLTNQCNLKCAHCFIVKEVQPQLDLITLDEYRKMFGSVRGRVSQVLLTGGEPTLRRDFVDIVVAASEAGRIATANVFSNGLRVEKLLGMLEQIVDRCDIRLNFQTSIDGLRESHDVIRRAPGAFDQTVETIKRVGELARRHPRRFGRITSTTAISKQNLGDLAEICRVLRSTEAAPSFVFVRTADDVFGLSDQSLRSDFTPEETKADGTAKFAGDDYLTIADMDQALEVLDREIWRHDPGRLQYSYNRTTLHAVRDLKASGKSPLAAECRMGYDDLVVLADGLVSRCENLVAPVSLRDFDFDVPRMLASPGWRTYLQRTSGCWCTHDCGIGISIIKEPTLLKQLC